MQVLVGKDVDALSPFPSVGIPAAAQWMRCYKTLIFGDNGPQTNDEIEDYLRQLLSWPQMRSWAFVDKHNLTRTKSEAPLVGILMFERENLYNGYVHIACNRRAWGEKVAQPCFTDQIVPAILDEIFTSTPELQRLSVMTAANNNAAKGLAKRMGFHKDGYFMKMSSQRGKPVDIVHFGLVRPRTLEAAEQPAPQEV